MRKTTHTPADPEVLVAENTLGMCGTSGGIPAGHIGARKGMIRGGIVMSSKNAAPIWRTTSGARVVDFARQQERRRIRRHLEETTQLTLEVIATAGDDLSATELELLADAEATRLRDFLEELGGERIDGVAPAPASINDAVARLHADVHVPICCMLHDTTLQMLEYLSTDGYGAQLSAGNVRGLALQALTDLRDRLDRLGDEETGELLSGLRSVIGEAGSLGLQCVELVTGEVDGSITGDDAAALVAAVREALNNVRKHSRATRVLINCDVKDGEAHITVRDNGIGVDPDTLGGVGGMGVRQSIFKRMSNRGGMASLQSAPGKGVLVTLRMANGGRVA
jgi:two-component sensor histidine kinase